MKYIQERNEFYGVNHNSIMPLADLTDHIDVNREAKWMNEPVIS